MNLGFWSLFLLVPVVSLALLRVAGEAINKVSLVNITTVSLYLFSVVGTLPLFYKWNAYRVASGVTDPALVLQVLFYSAVNITFFLLGVIVVRRVIGLRSIPVLSDRIKRLVPVQSLLLAGLFLLCLGVLWIYLKHVDRIALFVAFTDGAHAAAVARSEMTNAFGSNYHWFSLVLRDVGLLITLVSFIAWLRQKRLTLLLFFAATFGFSTFVSVMAVEKGPFVWLLAGLFMAYYLAKRDGYVPLRKVTYFGGLLLAVLVLFYVFFMGSSNPLAALRSVFSRAFSGGIEPAYFYLQYFPDHQPYLFGRTFPNPHGIFPYEPVRYTVDVMNWVFPKLQEQGITGSMPTVFWGESYANFGVVGIPVMAIIMGAEVAIIDYLLSRLAITPISLAFTVWLILQFRTLASTGFSGFLIFPFYIAVVGFVVALLLIATGRVLVRRRTRRLVEGVLQ